MAEIVVFNWNAANAMHYQPKNLVKPALPVQVSLTEDFQAVVQKDPLLQQRIVDAVKAEFVKSAAHLDRLLTSKDRLAAAKAEQDIYQMQQQYDQTAKVTMLATVSYAENAIDGVITDLAKTRTEYSSYRKKAAVKVGLGVAGVVLSGVGMVGAVAAGGAPLGIALAGAWRGLVDLAKTCKNLGLEAEGMGQKVSEGLQQLKAAYAKSASKPKVAAREVGVSVLNSVTQLEMQNIPKVKSNNDLWKSKLQGLRTKAHDLAEKLNNFLLLADKAQLVLNKDPRSWKARRELEQLAGKVQDALDKIPELHQRTETGLRGQEEAGKALSLLEQKSPAWTQAFDKWFSIAVNLGLAGTGDVMGFIEAEAFDALTAVTSINDIASATNDAMS